jgi:S-adenosylmethionine:tRNA ribosyltransferase-isomerase
MSSGTARTSFVLPARAAATAPPEYRGLSRDGSRLLIARPGTVEHRRFIDLPDVLRRGDMVVINTSATLPAALDGVDGSGNPVPVHVSTGLDDDTWVVEIRCADNSGPDRSRAPGEEFRLAGGANLRLLEPYPDPGAQGSRLWRATPSTGGTPIPYLLAHGRPIEYDYLSGSFPLTDRQNVYAVSPGSAEMASAGRPITDRILVRMLAREITVAPLVLHTGVSSPEVHEAPTPERFTVPESTADLVNLAIARGRRVIAVGTTVVRALESAAGPDGVVRARSDWTDLVIGPDRPIRAVDGLLTGLHAPEAGHLAILEAIAGPELVAGAYAEALAQGYLWHEFGDSTLFLP